METVRCGKCSKKLAEAEYVRLSIKCPRCGTMNQMKAASLKPERPGASIRKEMIISVNDIPEMRQTFAGLRMESVPITYTVGGGRKASKTAELVIRSW